MAASPTLPAALTEALRTVRSIGVITGAGISAESGIQTYRGQGGVYDDPEEGDRTVEALSGPTLRRDPDRTWRAVASVAQQAIRAEPNAGHDAIAEMEKRASRFTLLTQNVDGLHRNAGSQNVIEIHGTIFETVCMTCLDRRRVDRSFYEAIESAPKCTACPGTLRPNVVLFEEMLPIGEVERMQEMTFEIPDLVISVGTTALFPYILEPMLRAVEAGKVTVEINPESTMLTEYVEYPLCGKAGEFLPLIAAVIPQSPGR